MSLTESELLETLYEGVGKPDGWRHFIGALAECYPGGKGLFGLHDAALGTSFVQAESFWEQGEVDAYNCHYGRLNPWLPRLCRLPVGTAATGDSLISSEELRSTEFFNDFLRPAGIEDGIGAVVQQGDSRFMIASVVYPRDTLERDPEAVGRFQRLLPHLLRAAQLQRQLATVQLSATIAEKAADLFSTAVLVLAAGGKVAWMNHSAESMVRAQDGFALRFGRLVAANSADDQALQQLLIGAWRCRDEAGPPPGGAIRISRSGGQLAFEVLVTPLPCNTFAGAPKGQLAAVFIRDPGAISSFSRTLARQLYGLTHAEARLWDALIRGLTLEEASEKFGVSKETVRTQLRSTLAKTGARSQTDLVRQALRGIAGFQTRSPE